MTEKRKINLPTLLLAISVVVVFLATGLSIFSNLGCSAFGGRWASATGSCYTRWCYYFGDCGGPWVNTRIPCEKLPEAVSIAELYFDFGNPEFVNASKDEIRWATGKPETRVITAHLENGVLTKLECPAR